MRLLHMSDTLQIGMELKPDYKRNAGLVEPFIKALQVSRDCFFAMLLNAEYFREVLAKYKLSGMPSYETKWACEGIFEYIRRTEFPDQCSRLQSNYYFETLKLSTGTVLVDNIGAHKRDAESVPFVYRKTDL